MTDTLATVPVERAPKEGLMLLVIMNGQASIHSLPAHGECVVGRSRDCQVRVDDASLSRQHIKLHLGEEITVEDLETLNGTVVRGQRLKPNRAVTVAVGEAFEIGTVLVMLQRASERWTAAAPTGPKDPMAELHKIVDRVAPSDLNVLIFGETGVGKEVLSERIHLLSNRAKKPFVRINCAAISPALLESELFGHERGAFTGAAQTKTGLLEAAHEGTVLLDEIGEMSIDLQAKLLRAVDQRQILRVGSVQPRTIDVRFLSATHRNLNQAIADGRFREDLYFRLAGICLHIPALRDRSSEILSLAELFIGRTAERAGKKPLALNADVTAALRSYRWPGNVRELKNVVERAVVLAGTGPITVEHIVLDQSQPASQPAASSAFGDDDDDERRRIMDALAQCGGSQTRAAKALGISRRTLTNRLNAFKLPRPRK